MTYYNWKPRRTIIFAAWGAGEFGNIGSGEWVEEHLEQLHQVCLNPLSKYKINSLYDKLDNFTGLLYFIERGGVHKR